MPVLAAVSCLERHREAVAGKEGGHRFELFADALGVELADQCSVPEAGRHSRDYTTATPLDAGRIGSPTACRHDARRACQDPAESARGALHRRRPAGRLAHALARQRPRAVAGDDPKRHGRSRGARPDRQPAHQRRPRAHGARLPALRRHHAHRADEPAAARLRRAAHRGAAPRRPAAARHRQRGAAAVEPVELRRRDHGAEEGERVPPHRVHAPVGAARSGDPGRARRRRAEPRHLHGPGLHRVAAAGGEQLPHLALRGPHARGGARAPEDRGRRAARRDLGADAGRGAGRQRRDRREPRAGRDRRRAKPARRSRTCRATWAACASCSTCSSRRPS